MADNFLVSPGSGGTIATEDYAGAHHQLVMLGANSTYKWWGTALLNGTADFAVQAAPGAGTSLWLTNISCIGAGTVATSIDVKQGSTIVWQGYVPATAGGGFVVSIPDGLRLADNAALNVACGTTGGTAYFNASGFKGP